MAAPRKDNVRNIVLDATENLLKTKGLADISLAEIAAAAGISKGTLYYHYKTKNDILFDITDRYLNTQWDELIAWTENKQKDTSIHRLVKYVVERNIASAELRLPLLNEAMLGNEVMRKKLIDRYQEFQNLISRKLAERSSSISSDYLAWLILLASDGLIIQESLGNSNIDITGFISQSAKYLTEIKDE